MLTSLEMNREGYGEAMKSWTWSWFGYYKIDLNNSLPKVAIRLIDLWRCWVSCIHVQVIVLDWRYVCIQGTTEYSL
jgi:hypothetical protein